MHNMKPRTLGPTASERAGSRLGADAASCVFRVCFSLVRTICPFFRSREESAGACSMRCISLWGYACTRYVAMKLHEIRPSRGDGITVVADSLQWTKGRSEICRILACFFVPHIFSGSTPLCLCCTYSLHVHHPLSALLPLQDDDHIRVYVLTHPESATH